MQSLQSPAGRPRSTKNIKGLIKHEVCASLGNQVTDLHRYLTPTDWNIYESHMKGLAVHLGGPARMNPPGPTVDNAEERQWPSLVCIN